MSVNNFKSNWTDLIKKKNKELDRLHEIYVNLIKNSGCDLISGWGKVIGPNKVSIKKNDGDVLEFSSKKIMIAVGGESSFPSFEGNNFMINSDIALDINKLPNSIAIYGSGYIAVEFAGMFNGLGVNTTLVYRGEQILRGFDDEVRDHLAAEMQVKGVAIKTESDIAAIAKTATGFTVTYQDGSTQDTGLVMYATGRVPMTDALGLENAGVDLGAKGEVKVDAHSKTNI